MATYKDGTSITVGDEVTAAGRRGLVSEVDNPGANGKVVVSFFEGDALFGAFQPGELTLAGAEPVPAEPEKKE
jgi:hypothetical protein